MNKKVCLICCIVFLSRQALYAQNGKLSDAEWFFTGGFIGILFFLAVFTLLQFFQHRDRSYLWYTGYISSLWLFYMAKSAQNGVDFLGFSDDWWQFDRYATIIITAAFYVLFVRSLLGIGTGKDSNRTDRLTFYVAYGIIGASIMAKVLVAYNALPIAFRLTPHTLMALFAPWFLYRIARAPSRLKWFILTGTLILVVLSLMSTLSSTLMGYYQNAEKYRSIQERFGNPFFSFSQIGVLVEIMIFSTGLGYKTRLLNREKEEAQAALIGQLEENKTLQQRHAETLEREVESRTREALEQRAAAYNAEINQKLAEAELKAVKAQMNPHFTFNCMNSIKNLIQNHEEEAAIAYLTKFSRLIRSVLNYSEKQHITLQEEFDFCDLYLRMEALRFGHSFRWEVNVASDLFPESVNVPPLFLQPYLENAVWHGLMHKDGERLLRLSALRDGNNLVCCVEDNGIGRQKAQQARSRALRDDKSFGLRLAGERLSLSDKKISVKIFDKTGNNGEPEGTKIEITIPMKA